MVLNKGGYVMINKAQDNVYELVTSALTSGKPILWYETNTECYFIDTITLSGTDIILTKGGKTITIKSDGDITEVGNVQTLLEEIKDKDGHIRFITVDNLNETIEGVTFTYSKSSLSGSHLLIVVAGTIANATTLANDDLLCEIPIAQWIINKIFPIFDDVVVLKTIAIHNDDWTDQDITIKLSKVGSNLLIKNIGSFTATADRNFRIAFDLLIEN